MRYFYYPFIFCLGLICFSCNTEKSQTPVVEQPVLEEEEIPADSDNIIEELDEKTGVQIPTIWHSPRLLIQQLGNLEDKIIANIGAGPYGYFSFELADEEKKVIAIDID